MDRCRQARYLMHTFREMSCDYEEDYAGHYIVVCGHNVQMRCFYYKDPSCQSGLCCIPFSEFEHAWHCYGTDSDIVFIDVKDTNNVGLH